MNLGPESSFTNNVVLLVTGSVTVTYPEICCAKDVPYGCSILRLFCLRGEQFVSLQHQAVVVSESELAYPAWWYRPQRSRVGTLSFAENQAPRQEVHHGKPRSDLHAGT